MFMKTFSKPHAPWLLLLLLLVTARTEVQAQTATVSMPFAVGRSGCGSGTHRVHFYDYDGATNTISNATTPATCVPVLKIGQKKLSPFADSTFTFTSNLASVSYNPKDTCIYYLYTRYSPLKTYVWKYKVGTCPTSTSPRLDTLRSFDYDILGVAFDKNGNGWMLDFTGAAAPYTAVMRSIDFVTGVIGPAKNLALTGGAKIYEVGSGDIAISPSGQMFFVVDNKLFTPDYLSYANASPTITCTYIDSVRAPGLKLVGLTYAQGKLLASYSGGSTCRYREVNSFTGDTTVISQGAGVQSGSDFASVISGIGASKKLVSVDTVIGTPNQYNVVYDVYVKNYGNYPLNNIQVADNLGAINAISNVSNVSAAIVGAAPPGIALNGSYNGTTNTNLLAATGQSLPAYPVSQNSFTIRIKCRLSNIIPGKTYNNSAVATGTGFNSASLRDSSTNGAVPDLNTNDKPDDGGESQPTPLLIAITPQTPPCSALGQVFYSQDFGTGANAATLPLTPSGRTTYTGSTTQPLAVDGFMLASNANAGDNARFISLTDHTTGAGRMMIVNADASNKIFYSDTVSALCANQQYSLSFYAAFIGNPGYQTICDGFGGFKYPRVRMRVKNLATGLIITEIATADITATSWNQYGMKWVMPSGYSNVIFELLNDGQGGCGNDIALDDIQFGTCDAAPVVSISAASAGCVGSATTMAASLSDAGVIPGTKEYQWQVSTDNTTFTNISGALADTYTINPVTASNVNKYYRVLVAAQGSIGSANCRYASPGSFLALKAASTAPTTIIQSRTALCPGESVSLRASGATLGAGAVYRWYTGSCGGTLIGTGATITVSPAVATTYWVRVEGDCNTTACINTTITFTCDIDDDNDGITDLAEHNGSDADADDDLDGIKNYLDATYPGFADANSDGVNDKFDADSDGIINSLDLDSDNDGIPDVVESGGVDAAGDGRIDNYTDTDGDGLSQNIDANNTGYLSSGTGLSTPDLDGDGVPNFLDLDSDNDGIPDVVEAGGTDANNNGMIDGYTDADSDGFSQNIDGDTNNDGTAENAANTLLRTGADTNGDGRYESMPYKNMDRDSKANPHDLDSDGDGISDVREAGFNDADQNSRIDGTLNARGWSTIVSEMGTLNLLNTDGTGPRDAYDIDADDDGIPDTIEGMPSNNYWLPAYADADGDGIDNTYDDFSGFGGSGINPVNTDGDAFPDYRDGDSDSDGIIDRIEGNDFNLNTYPDDDVTLSGTDTDGDGLDDTFDADNTTANTTSARIGNGGTYSGPTTPGSRTTVQKSWFMLSDRDWRDVGYVLEVNFIDMQATLKGNTAQVLWSVSGGEHTEKYIVERSVNGFTFQNIQTIAGGRNVKYTIADNLNGNSAATIYYRIKAVGVGGKVRYSTTATVHLANEDKREMLVFPNPVHQLLKVRLYTGASGQATFTITTIEGRQATQFVKPVAAGYNEVLYDNAGRLPNGVYILRMELKGAVVQQQFMVQH